MAPLPSLKINVIQTVQKQHHDQAVLHYHKAIQLLNQYISDSSSPQLRTALIACILFVCFETIQGGFASSIQQIYGGLKLLRSYCRARIPLGKDATKSTTSSGSTEGLDGNENDAVISAQVKAYFESAAWHEAPQQLSMSTQTISQRDFPIRPLVADQANLQTRQAEFLLQPPILMSNQTMSESPGEPVEHIEHNLTWTQDSRQFEFQLGSVTFTEPDYQSTVASSSTRQMSTVYGQHLSIQPLLKSSRKRSRSREQTRQSPKQDFSDASFRNMETEHTKYRSMSTISLDDNSSAYSSDSSYREPSPHHLQPNTNTTTVRRSSLSTSFSQREPIVSQETAEKDLSPSSTTQTFLHRTLEIEDSIIQTLVRLDGPGLFFGMPPGIPVLNWDIHQSFHLSIPSHFSSHSSAQRCWDFLMDRALHFYSTTLYNRLHKPHTITSTNLSSISRQHDSFVQEITAFQRSFQPLLTAASCADTFHAPTLLTSLYATSTLILLAQTTCPSEMTYDTFLPGFKHIISTCSLLLSKAHPPLANQIQNQSQSQSSSRFSFSIGIIPPLHLTATKCRDPHVRRTAIELLFESQRQEGLWDGTLCGRIGRWVMGCEEEGMLPFEPLNHNNNDNAKFKENKKTPPFSSTDSSGKRITMTLPQRSRNLQPTTSIINPHTSSHRENPNNPAEQNAEQQKEEKWIVPIENRTQLTSISFHIPDRYIKVKCQRVGGGKEVRETVIAW